MGFWTRNPSARDPKLTAVDEVAKIILDSLIMPDAGLTAAAICGAKMRRLATGTALET